MAKNKAMPSLMALLGLAAVAGYQNRDKLRDMIAGAGAGGGAPGAGQGESRGTGSGGILDEIGKTFGGGDSGRNLKDGLDSLLDRFRTNGQAEKADSWVSADANRDLGDGDLETAIGEDTLDELAQRTGLSRSDLVARLKTALPETVNRLTPRGHVPDETEARDLL
jgi:uncharacterized protein YidB (DUF937 family)